MIASFSLQDSHPSSILSISPLLPVLSSRCRSHDGCMLNWLPVGEGDIWAGNYYVLSCSISVMSLSLFLNVSGQDWVLSQGGEREEKVSIMNQNALQERNPEHVISSPLCYQTCHLEHLQFWMFSFHTIFFFLNLSLKELTFNLDATILQWEWSIWNVLSRCWVTSHRNVQNHEYQWLEQSHILW